MVHNIAANMLTIYVVITVDAHNKHGKVSNNGCQHM